MIPIVGALMGGGASGIFGGAGGGGLFGGLMGSLMQNGGLGGMFMKLFGGSPQSEGNQQREQLLGDIKNMLGDLLDKKGGDCGGAGGAGHDCGGVQPLPYRPGGEDCGGCHDEVESKPLPYRPEGDDCGGCHDAKEPACGGAEEHGCDDAKQPEWDGKDKSPSLDRERGAARLLEQAKNTDDPEQKRELIEMALDMLGKGPKTDGLFGKVREERDGNSYDKDIVKQARKMLDQIDEGDLNGCNESKALDSVADMLMEEGGVDGKPAASDTDGNGGEDGDHCCDRPMPFVHHHLHSVLFDDH